MRSALKTRMFLAGVAALLLAGCAGTDFVRPSSDTFKLGRTTSAQVLQVMGQPRNTGEGLKNGKTVKTMTFVYAATGGEPLEPGVIPARANTYSFHNDVLVGQEFMSSFKSDHSDFDDRKVPGIVTGQTARKDVIAMMGRPSIQYLPPMVKETSGEAIGYAYATTRGGAFSGFKFHRKVLVISFDGRDIVSDVEFRTEGNQ